MTYILKPINHHPNLPTNKLGLTRRDYEGSVSSLCAGCGHDSISAAIVDACFELNIEGHQVAKLSGIGCSSKAPNYFLNKSHGFNSVHGRMPSVMTGACLANHELLYLGVSGDGDTASIGMGQFVHSARRQLNAVYIVENNGTYGLTKGQFSATNDLESKSKYGEDNLFPAIDLPLMAVQLGASFVARSFSGDKDQLVPLLIAAIQHKGFSFIDIISPCVTFNNHSSSTKSYDYIREHNEAVSKPDFVPIENEITVEYNSGDNVEVKLHDGSFLNLEKTSKEYDPTNKLKALNNMQTAQSKGNILTGLLYINSNVKDLKDILNASDEPLNSLQENVLCPGSDNLEKINLTLK